MSVLHLISGVLCKKLYFLVCVKKYFTYPTCFCTGATFDNLATGCDLCSNKCATCSTTASNCGTCSNAGRNTPPTCGCNFGTYDNGSNLIFTI